MYFKVQFRLISLSGCADISYGLTSCNLLHLAYSYRAKVSIKCTVLTIIMLYENIVAIPSAAFTVILSLVMRTCVKYFEHYTVSCCHDFFS